MEQNFAHVTKLLVEKYPSLIYTKTQPVGGDREYLPVEKALMLYNDDTAAYLISQMQAERWETLVLCLVGFLVLFSVVKPGEQFF